MPLNIYTLRKIIPYINEYIYIISFLFVHLNPNNEPLIKIKDY